MDYNNILFQYYPSKVWIQEPLGTVSLNQFIEAIRAPKEKVRSTFIEISKAAEKGNIARKDYLKQNHLYYVTPSVVTNGKGRKLTDITSFNPIMTVEFDKIDFTEELKQYLFDRMTCIIAAFTSPSKTGCKFLVRIPKVDSVDEYKEYFCGLAYYLDQIEGFDIANYNCILPLFISWDENILVRKAEDVTEWNIKGAKMNAFVKGNIEDFEAPEEITEKDREYIIKSVEGVFDKIEKERTAHSHILSLSFWCGGIVGAGYMSYKEMEEYLYSKIEESDYCSKNMRGYKKTTSDMLNRGISKPIKIDYEY